MQSGCSNAAADTPEKEKRYLRRRTRMQPTSIKTVVFRTFFAQQIPDSL
jgi:hypothetical protein